MCLMPAPLSFNNLEGILTGVWMLACVSLLRVNRKAGTKPMCLWSWETHLGIFSALLWVKLHQRGGGGPRLYIDFILSVNLSIGSVKNLNKQLGESLLKVVVDI